MTAGDDDLRDLLARFMEGSEQATRELLGQYGGYVLLCVRKRLPPELRRTFDSDDFSQLVWGTIFRHRNRLKSIDDPNAFLPYLAAITANKVRMAIRAMNAQRRRGVNLQDRDDDIAIAEQSHNGTPSEIAIAREWWDSVMKDRPARHKAIIRLRVQGYTYDEIAAKLGMHEGSIRRIYRSITRDMLDES